MCGRKQLDRAWLEASFVIEALGWSKCGVGGGVLGAPSDSFKLTDAVRTHEGGRLCGSRELCQF